MQHFLACSRHPDAKASQQAGYLTPRSGGMATVFPGFNDSGLRALRLWHWQQVSMASNRAEWASRQGPIYSKMRDAASSDWNFHMGAVQALNDCFDIDDTAEKDAAK